MSFYVSTATFFLLHCDEWDRVVALPRHKFVTGATLLQLVPSKHHARNVQFNLVHWLIFLNNILSNPTNLYFQQKMGKLIHRKSWIISCLPPFINFTSTYLIKKKMSGYVCLRILYDRLRAVLFLPVITG